MRERRKERNTSKCERNVWKRERRERVKRLQNTLPFCIGYEIKISERESESFSFCCGRFEWERERVSERDGMGESFRWAYVINLCKVIFKTKNRTNKTTNTPLALFKRRNVTMCVWVSEWVRAAIKSIREKESNRERVKKNLIIN